MDEMYPFVLKGSMERAGPFRAGAMMPIVVMPDQTRRMLGRRGARGPSKTRVQRSRHEGGLPRAARAEEAVQAEELAEILTRLISRLNAQ
jgi:hypothetical protein